MRLAILSCENFEAFTRVAFEKRVQNYKQKKEEISSLDCQYLLSRQSEVFSTSSVLVKFTVSHELDFSISTFFFFK